MPAWRNWQTRWTQNPVPARACRFDPGRRYHTKNKPREMVFHPSGLVFLGSLSNGADVRQVCFAPRDICTLVKLGFAEVQMSLTPLNSGERPLTGTERLDCFRTSGESLLIGGTELSSLSYLDSSADSHRFYLYPVIFLGT